MIGIAGRRVKFAAGRGKSQSVNVCTVDAIAGQYDWVLDLPAGTFQAEAELAAFGGDTIEGFVTWLRQRHGATVRQWPAVTTLSARAVAPAASGEDDRGSAKTGIFAGVDGLVDAALGVQDVGRSPHHQRIGSALRLSGARPTHVDAAALLSQLYARVEANGQRSTRLAPSIQNWRVEKMLQIRADNVRPETQLEKAIVHATGAAWTNQMPTASGLVTPHETHRNVDLVHRVGPRAFELIELKVDADTPLYAAFEIVKYGLAYLYSRRHRARLGYQPLQQAPLWADVIRLRVLAPAGYYARYDLAWLERSLNVGLDGLVDPSRDEALRMDFRFERFAPGFEVSARGEALVGALARREAVVWGTVSGR